MYMNTVYTVWQQSTQALRFDYIVYNEYSKDIFQDPPEPKWSHEEFNMRQSRNTKWLNFTFLQKQFFLMADLPF